MSLRTEQLLSRKDNLKWHEILGRVKTKAKLLHPGPIHLEVTGVPGFKSTVVSRILGRVCLMR